MARQSRPLIIIATLLIACPAMGRDSEDPKPNAQPAKRPIQIRVQPAVMALGGAANNPLSLIRIPAVQDELKLSDEQKEKIQEATQAINTKRQEMFRAIRGLQPDQRQKKMAELRKKVQEKTDEANKTIKDTLKPEQTNRLEQIALQNRGIRALSDEKTAKTLEITDEQKQAIQDVSAEGQQKRQQLLQDVRNGNVERGKYRGKIQEITKETEVKTMDVLTDKQKAKFTEMKGPKFDMPQRRVNFQAVPVQPGQLKKIQPRQIQPKQLQLKRAKQQEL